MIVTVYNEEEASEKSKEGYTLVSVNTMTEYSYEYVGNDSAQQQIPTMSYLAYTLQHTFLNKMAKAVNKGK